MSQDKKGLNPLATGVAGAIIGAAAGAAAVVLSDEKNRGKADKGCISRKTGRRKIRSFSQNFQGCKN